MRKISCLLFALFLLLAPLSAHAAIGTPSTLGTANTTTSSATSLTVTTTAPIVSGNLVVVAIINFANSGASVSSVSDGTNTYTQWNTGQYFGVSSLWYVKNATAVSSSASLVVTFSGAIGSPSYAAAFVSQVSGASTEDTGSQNTNDTGGQPNISTNALAVANEIIFGFTNGQISVSTSTYSEDTADGWTNLYNTHSSNNPDGGSYLYPAFSYKVVSSASAVTWAPTFSFIDNGSLSTIGGWEASSAPAAICTISLLGAGPC